MKNRKTVLKTIFLLLILSMISICSLSAYDFLPDRFFLAPSATSSIDLRNWNYYPTRNGFEKTLAKEIPNKGDFSTSPAVYTNKNMFMLGGYAGSGASGAELREILRGATLNIYISTDSGQMELVSRSNGAYRWPFEFWLVIRTSTANTAIAQAERTISALKVSDTNRIFRSQPLDFRKGAEGKSDYIYQEGGTLYDGGCVFFDMIIAFPVKEGSFDEDNLSLKDENGTTYHIGEKDDYFSMVTVTMNIEKNGQTLGAGKSLTIPLSGYYRKDRSLTADSIASLSVLLNAAASTLDLATESNKLIKIGDVSLMANYFMSDTENIPKHVHLFLSSSPNPQVKGDYFRFMATEYITPTENNSLPFHLYLIGENGYYEESVSPRTTEFDGTHSTPMSAVNINHKSYASAKLFKPQVLTASYNTSYFQYEGGIYIETDRVAEGQLVSGIYQEDVYVHVFSDK